MKFELIQHKFVSKVTQENLQNQLVEETKFAAATIFDWLVLIFYTLMAHLYLGELCLYSFELCLYSLDKVNK